ncbi:MAG: terminase small subunit [Halanaerobiales bacterium]
MARPVKYTPEELSNAIDEYWKDRINPDNKINFVSIVDLCNYLEIDRQTFYNYKNKPSYSTAIKKAESRIISIWEQQLMLPGRNTTGAIFYLKNYGGMADKVEHRHSGQIEHKHSARLEDLPDNQLQKLSEALELIEQQDNTIDITPENDNSPENEEKQDQS